jgi:NTE family protein
LDRAENQTHERPTLRAWLAGGDYTLAMSSGFFAFFAHTGMMTALEDAGLLPARVSGSSAGALVGGAWAGGVDAPVLAAELERLERSHFWDPAPGLGLLRGKLFRDKLHAMLGGRGFADTRVPATVSAFDVRTRSTHVLTHGALAPAIHASCAVPLLFHPVVIGGRPYLDGGILDRPGLLGVPSSARRVLFHHIGSKSPWRSALEMPEREGMVTLVMDGLPRSGPFALAEGRRAFAAAREAMTRALDARIAGASVVVAVR